MGADVVHLPAVGHEACFKHPLTDIGLERFLKDWQKAQDASAKAKSKARVGARDAAHPIGSPNWSGWPSSAAERIASSVSIRPGS